MDDVDEVIWMVRGAWVTLCMRATCELGLVDALDEPRSLAQLAAQTGCDEGTLGRLLRVLVDLRLLAQAEHQFVATPRGRVLGTGHPSAVRDLVLMQTVAPNLTAWSHLADAVRDGESVYVKLHGHSSWEWLAAHPAQQAVFNASMARRAAFQAQSILAAVDLSAARLLIDVGGGDGALVAALLAVTPQLHAIIADQPDVAASATQSLAAAGLGDRAHGQATDFFTAVPPGGDIYVLSNVVHDWDDEAAITILRNVRAAMTPASQLLVVENVLNATGRSPAQQRDVHLVDLHMLVMFGGRERSRSEYGALLVRAGFEPPTLTASPNTWNVLVTRPVTDTTPPW
jgi:tRNA A58 N-methylase Trm61